MKNNTMIPYNPKKDLETNYYNKTEVELLVAGGSGGSIDLSNYYKKLETYSKAQVDALVAGGGADLSDYYTKAEVESLISAIPATDLTNYYNKTQVDSLIPNISTKQDTLVSATNIKTINGQSVLGSGDLVISGGGAVDLSEYYKKTETETLLSNKVDKVIGKGLSTNDFTDTFKQAIELKKVQGISTDSVTKKLVVNYTDSTVANLNINDIITDVHVSGATLDATTNVLTLTSTDGGADVTVNLSDFVNSGELTSALSGKADNIHSHSTSNITGLDAILSNKVTKNEAIIGATKTKITYDSNGLVTGGADLVEADLPNISQSKITNLVSDLSNKQSSLISGTNIKTINGQSVLGSGDLVISSGGAVDLSDYYKKTETYSKVEVDTKIADIPTTDLSGYYNKTETYSKVETNSLVATKQDVLVSGTNIKTINGQSVLGSGDITISDATAVQLTGNQTIAGIKTFSSNIVGNITGNSATATKLATARTINGVSFDGSTNITISDATAVKLTGDETIAGIKTFSSNIAGSITGNSGTATKLATARTIGGVSFDGTANINLPGVNAAGNQNTTGNAGSATKLATARTINGVAFDGSANITVSDDTKLTKTNPSITGSVTEQVYNLTGTVINPANGTIQYKTVSANTTFTETLISGQSVLLRLINATSYTITFPTITWVGADAPILTANCAIALWKEQSTLYGAYIGTLVW